MEEYLSSKSIEELCDLEEVIQAILNARGVSLEQFEAIRLQKKAQRGGFAKGIILTEVKEKP